jgi:hypothetical protein
MTTPRTHDHAIEHEEPDLEHEAHEPDHDPQPVEDEDV